MMSNCEKSIIMETNVGIHNISKQEDTVDNGKVFFESNLMKHTDGLSDMVRKVNHV